MFKGKGMGDGGWEQSSMLLGSIQADCFPLGPELATGIVLIMLHCSRSTIIIIIESTTTITNNIIILDIYDIYVSWADGL